MQFFLIPALIGLSCSQVPGLLMNTTTSSAFTATSSSFTNDTSTSLMSSTTLGTGSNSTLATKSTTSTTAGILPTSSPKLKQVGTPLHSPIVLQLYANCKNQTSGQDRNCILANSIFVLSAALDGCLMAAVNSSNYARVLCWEQAFGSVFMALENKTLS